MRDNSSEGCPMLLGVNRQEMDEGGSAYVGFPRSLERRLSLWPALAVMFHQGCRLRQEKRFHYCGQLLRGSSCRVGKRDLPPWTAPGTVVGLRCGTG